ncbi:MAG: TolC family protein, partial [Bdellovibrionales bacterium]|nr:TolC family protein [Bdellovibrionales bacterium]NQZ19856.1 TolC family protein [Bdellovibrionales bacterium]
ANMRFRQAQVNSCEEAFDLYSDTYIQQERWAVLNAQLKDAKKALNLARKLYRDKLIDKVDLITSENDFLETKVQANQAQQLLVNNKRQMMAFFKKENITNMTLRSPNSFLGSLPQKQGRTFSELIANERLKSQEFAVDQARSDRWTDVQLGLEAGQRKGRFGFSGVLTNFTEDYLYATLSVSFDVINRTEDGALKSAIDQRNSLTVQQQITKKTQDSVVDNLFESNTLLKTLVDTSEKQVKMLNEKAEIAFLQMKRGRLDFQNYLIHRNAYSTHQINTLNLKKDLWMNHFSLKKEYTQENGSFCKGES